MKKQLITATLVTAMVLPSFAGFAEELPLDSETKKQIEAVSNELPLAEQAAVIKSFLDVPTSHYAYKEVMGMTEQGIIKGYPDGTFKPNLSISREHVALMFYRAFDLGNKEPIRKGMNFKDVPKNYMYYDEIQAVYQAGIFDGKDGNSFDPTAPMTRAEMAKVLVTAFDLERHKGYIFKDVGEKHWAKDYIATLYAHGIAKGSNGNYMPNEPIKRADFSILLYNALNPDEVTKPTEPLKPNPVTPPVEEKPVEPKPTEPKPTTPPVNEKFNFKYENVHPDDIKRPSGYVKRTHEETHQATIKKWMHEDKSRTIGGGTFRVYRSEVERHIKTDLFKSLGLNINTYEELMAVQAKELHLTLSEFSYVLTKAIETGKVVHYTNKANTHEYVFYYHYLGGTMDHGMRSVGKRSIHE